MANGSKKNPGNGIVRLLLPRPGHLPVPSSQPPLRTWLAGFFCALLLCTPALAQSSPAPSQASAQGAEEAAPFPEETLLPAAEDGFVYKREGRPDPFMPFISEKMIQAEIARAHESLSGLQRFEPGQLSLVAIIFAGDTGVAMAQDPSGIGYIIRKGMKIGLSGEVADIVANAVIVKQKYQTISGKTRYKTLEMVLKKEGEK